MSGSLSDDAERRPLLESAKPAPRFTIKRVVASVLTFAFVLAGILFLVFYKNARHLPDDPLEAALVILGRYPAIVCIYQKITPLV